MQCRKCGAEPGPAGFYLNNRTCKECVKAQVRLRARMNPAVQEYDRARAKKADRKARARAVTIQWRRENPIAYRAQTAVGNAIRDGKLEKKPCEVCGDSKVHAHHDDYAKPLDVRWLCALHHHRLHADDPSAEGVNKKEILCLPS